MFNIFKTKEDRMKEVIEEIHDAFNSEGERLLKEALGILAEAAKPEDEKMAERLVNAGFARHPLRRFVTERFEKQALSKKTAELIQYYQQAYPMNRFIDEAGVETICKKYDLYKGETGFYTGDIPTKNLADVENFKLRIEDALFLERERFSERNPRTVTYAQMYAVTSVYEAEDERERMKDGMLASDSYLSFKDRSLTRSVYYQSKADRKRYDKIGMEICAPLKDFDLTERETRGRNIVQKEILDPVVLQKVNGGYLIVTAWGIEAKDDLVFNPKHN